MRYTVGFVERINQLIRRDLFQTNDPVMAMNWWRIGFRVFDNVSGRQMHDLWDFNDGRKG